MICRFSSSWLHCIWTIYSAVLNQHAQPFWPHTEHSFWEMRFISESRTISHFCVCAMRCVSAWHYHFCERTVEHAVYISIYLSIYESKCSSDSLHFRLFRDYLILPSVYFESATFNSFVWMKTKKTVQITLTLPYAMREIGNHRGFGWQRKGK